MNVSAPWPVAVFAHNEARNIVACLDSLQAASAVPPTCHVLANACTDATESLVRNYARTHPGVHLVSIAVGDKANAWNVYVHEAAPPGQAAYFFMTAMCVPRPARSTSWRACSKESRTRTGCPRCR